MELDRPDSPDDLLTTRYGRPGPGRRRLLLGAIGIVVVAFLAWVVWVAWIHSTPEVDSELIGFTVVDDHTTTANVDVHFDEGSDPRCLARALAPDHSPVGDLFFTPRQGRNEISIRTERRATAVDLIGCTTVGQRAPR